MEQYDVIVVGKGNAALCAALSATEQGARVLMLEAASEDESGGNSRFAGGVMRFAYASVEDLRRVTDITDQEAANSDFGTNTREEFLDPGSTPAARWSAFYFNYPSGTGLVSGAVFGRMAGAGAGKAAKN